VPLATSFHVEPLYHEKSDNKTCTDCGDFNKHTLLWIIIGFLIGGLVFGVLCYIMGSLCSTTHRQNAKINSEHKEPSSSSSSEPALQIYNQSSVTPTPPEKPKRTILIKHEPEQSFSNAYFSSESEDDDEVNVPIISQMDKTTSISVKEFYTPPSKPQQPGQRLPKLIKFRSASDDMLPESTTWKNLRTLQDRVDCALTEINTVGSSSSSSKCPHKRVISASLTKKRPKRSNSTKVEVPCHNYPANLTHSQVTSSQKHIDLDETRRKLYNILDDAFAMTGDSGIDLMRSADTMQTSLDLPFR